MNGSAGLLHWPWVVCLTVGPWQGDPNHAVPRNDFRKLFLGPVFGPGRPHRQDHEAALLVRVLYSYLDVGRKHQSKLCQDFTRPSDDPAAIIGRAIPLR